MLLYISQVATNFAINYLKCYYCFSSELYLLNKKPFINN